MKCISHHHACDCREEKYQELFAEIAYLCAEVPEFFSRVETIGREAMLNEIHCTCSKEIEILSKVELLAKIAKIAAEGCAMSNPIGEGR